MKHEAMSTFQSITGSTLSSQSEPWALLGGVEGYLYERGWKDALLVATMVLIMTALRALWMKYVLLPLGDACVPAVRQSKSDDKDGKARSKAIRMREKEVLRFAEQGFSLTYYVMSWSLGLVSMACLMCKGALVSDLFDHLSRSISHRESRTGLSIQSNTGPTILTPSWML